MTVKTVRALLPLVCRFLGLGTVTSIPRVHPTTSTSRPSLIMPASAAASSASSAASQTRTNGFSHGLSVPQTLSWVTFIFLVCSFYTVFLAGAGPAARAAAGTVYGFFTLLSAAAAASATATDPRDSLDATAPSDSTGFYCPRCVRAVKKDTKHCGICHKCIDVFDRTSVARARVRRPRLFHSH